MARSKSRPKKTKQVKQTVNAFREGPASGADRTVAILPVKPSDGRLGPPTQLRSRTITKFVPVDEQSPLTNLVPVEIARPKRRKPVAKAKSPDTKLADFMDIDIDLPSIPSDDTASSEQRNQGVSILLSQFRNLESNIEAKILESHYHPDVGSICSTCKVQPVTHVCRDCFNPPMFCASCIVKQHLYNPFHRVEAWEKTHFVSSSLGELGLVINLGHHGQPCPNTTAQSGRHIFFVHSNGFHRIFVKFCYCGVGEEEYEQLLRARLYPGTFQLPSTVFTFTLLNEMQVHIDTSKSNVYDYHTSLSMLTDPTRFKEKPDRYNELSRVLREWRYLACVRRAGQAHGIDDYFPNRRKGSLVIRCFACPEMGLNIDEDTVLKTPVEKIHKITNYISTDGNFRLQLVGKSRDPLDTALNAGRAYFVDDRVYQEYLKFAQAPDDNSTCARLRAVRLQEVAKFKNTIVSGVVAVQCARHFHFRPSGTVDLNKGEAYARSDYAVINSLSETQQLRTFLAYDIYCQWSKKFMQRAASNLPDLLHIAQCISGAVGKMHIKGHDDQCQAQYSINYIPNTGETCGENLEPTWAEMNQGAASTKYMNAGNRHDTLDAFFMYWNWIKSIKLIDYLCPRYTECISKLMQRQADFEDQSKLFKPEQIAEWVTWDLIPRVIGGKVVSPYEIDRELGNPPSLRQAYADLLARENTEVRAGKISGGDTTFINEGLTIELHQWKVKEKLRGGKDCGADRERLKERLKEWIKQYLKKIPDVYDHDDPLDWSAPEEIKLLFPSVWPEDKRPRGLLPLSSIEFELRQGICYEALQDLKCSIKTEMVNKRFKKDQLRGQVAMTRSQGIIRGIRKETMKFFHTYNRSRHALLNLGLSGDDKSLQKLNKGDLWGRNMQVPAKHGVTRGKEPWFWTAGCPAGLSTDQIKQWELETERVRWFRNRAALQRTQEEVEILEEEILRVHASCVKMRSVWEDIAEKDGIEVGARCYAHKQAAMYARFGEDAYAAIVKTFGPSVEARVTNR